MRKPDTLENLRNKPSYPVSGASKDSSASASLSGAFNDPIIRNAMKSIRQDKRTIKDNHWIRPENH
jgi:hypothetical protein